MTLLAVFCCLTGARADELTVYDGTDNSSYVPFYGFYADTQGAASEVVIPSDQLVDMAGGEITAMTFYIQNPAADAWTGTHQVYIGEVDATTLTGITGPDAFTVVKTAIFDATGTELTVEFDEPYTYEGGNLLIGTYVSVAGNYKTAYFYGVGQEDNTGWYRNNGTATGNGVKFIPKTTFEYTPGSGSDCERPTNLVATVNDAHSATLTWASEVGSYNIEYKKASLPNDDWTSIEEDIELNEFKLTDLEQNTAYNARVRAVCDPDEGVYSAWRTVDFTTPVTCPAPTGVNVSNVTAHSATIGWDAVEGVNYVCALVKTADYNPETIELMPQENPAIFSNLDPETPYTFALRKECGGEDGVSQIVTTAFTTTIACPAPTGLTATLTPGNGTVATLSWTEPGDAGEWILEYSTAEDFTGATSVTMNDTPSANLTSLTAETTYYARVKANCGGEDGESQWSSTITFTPTDAYSITVNDDTNTNSYVPVYGMWVDSHSKSQFIIPADALADMTYGTINKLTFYASQANVNWGVAEFEVYMTEVNNTTFSEATLVDWTTMDKVMNAGSLAIVGNKMEITLDAPYQYLGGNLLIGILQPTSGTYSSSYWYGVTTEDNVAIGGYESSKAVSLQKFLPKTTFYYTPGEAPACPKPTSLAVNYEGGREATISWTSDATTWNLSVNGVETSVTENPYTLTNLDLGTTYEVKVRAACSETEISDWTNAVSFTTDDCMPEDMIIVNYTLSDSYGDGWNGNYILVVDENCNIVEQLTIESGSSATGTVKVCGSIAQFMWYPGSYPAETSWSFTDAEGNVLFEGAGDTSMQAYDLLYSIDKNPYSMPTDITVSEVGPHTATVAWTETGTATAWQIGFYNDEGEIDNIVDADSNPFTITGLDPETDYYVVVRAAGANGTSNWPCLGAEFTTDVAAPIPTGLAATHVTATSATLNWEGSAETYNVSYAPVAHGDVIKSIDFEDSSMGEWTTIDADGDGFDWVLGSACGGVYLAEDGSLAGKGHDESSADLVVSGSYSNYTGGALTPDNYLVSPQIALGGSISFWVCGQDATYAAEHFGVAVSTTGNTDAADFTTIWQNTLTAKGGNNRGNTAMFVKGGAKANPGTTRSGNRDQGNWYHYTVDLSDYSGQGYVAIRHFGCTDQFMLDLDDIVIEGPAEVQWINLTGVSGNSVDIDGLEDETEYMWKVQGYYGEQDGTSGWSTSNFTTGSFTDDPIDLEATDITSTTATLNWTGSQESYNVQYRTAATRDEYYFTDFNGGADAAHADGWSWNGYILYGLEDPINNIPGDENYFLQIGYSAQEETTDTIKCGPLPEYESGAVLEFHYFGYNTANTFEIGYATGDDPDAEDAFTWSEPIEAPLNMEYTLYSGALPAGVKYIAFRATASSANEAIFFDNVGIFGPTTPAGEWTTVTATESPFALTDLDPNTEYEWQVQGILDDGETDWVSDTFTTLPLIELANDATDNSAIIDENIDAVADVTLADRTLFKDGSWNTLCLPFDVELEGSPLEGATAKTLNSATMTGNHVSLTFGEAVTTLEAGVPYIIKWETPGDNIVNPTFTGVTIQEVDDDVHTVLPIDGVKFIGYYDAFGIDADDENIYYMTASNELKHTGKARTLKACRAYFEFSEAATAGGVREFTLNFGDSEATGIVSIDNEQLNNESGWYTVDGKKLDKQPKRKGVYINNGIKVVIK